MHRREATETPSFLYGTAWKEADTGRCVEEALNAGFRGIDTANQRRHYHEAAMGEALARAYAQGLVQRSDLFLQTKFTPLAGQDHRLPYDPAASLATQVQQSFASSLGHLATDRIDAYILHGPLQRHGLRQGDWEIWRAMEDLCRQDRVRHLGVSNVSLEQLQALWEGAQIKPSFVQNRCFAVSLWEKGIRDYCRERGITYQGFSLLTANAQHLGHPDFREIVARTGMTAAQVVFRFALEVGMLPLTGTTDPEHMREDLACLELHLSPEDVVRIEGLAAS